MLFSDVTVIVDSPLPPKAEIRHEPNQKITDNKKIYRYYLLPGAGPLR